MNKSILTCVKLGSDQFRTDKHTHTMCRHELLSGWFYLWTGPEMPQWDLASLFFFLNLSPIVYACWVLTIQDYFIIMWHCPDAVALHRRYLFFFWRENTERQNRRISWASVSTKILSSIIHSSTDAHVHEQKLHRVRSIFRREKEKERVSQMDGSCHVLSSSYLVHIKKTE